MILSHRYVLLALLLTLSMACNDQREKKTPTENTRVKGTYVYDAEFLKKHTVNVLELVNKDSSSKILLSADYQGRVMTSTANGDSGISFGWLNYRLIESGQKNKNFNPVGGEERFWLGPEGGQYSIYFKTGDSFNINAWQVPAVIDTVTYDVVHASSTEVTFSKKTSIVNYSGFGFDIHIRRRVKMIDRNFAEQSLHTSIPPELKFVGYETENSIENTGKKSWTKDSGLLSIWLLGMFTPTRETKVIIPFSPSVGARQHITDNYFGPIPRERLQVQDSVLIFSCDGKYRSKIGLSPVIAKPVAASFDFQNNVLTLVIPEIHREAPYVNSKWEIQKLPYKGDVINAYNDGPLEDGSQMGPFYEIESSSPALALNNGQIGTHRQITCHLQGNYSALKTLVMLILGTDLDSVRNATGKQRP